MLAVFTSWIIITFVFFSLGNALLTIYTYSLNKNDENHTLPDIFLMGMAATVSLIALCSLFIPADSRLLILLITLGFIYWTIQRKQLLTVLNNLRITIKSLSKLQLLLIVSPIIILLIHSLTAPLWVDTPYYHIQNIMWNEQYSVVPGLANLQPRFGFNSNYFLLCSVFGLKPIFGQYIFGVHQLCIVYIFMWIIYETIRSKSYARTIVPILIFCIFLSVYKLHITSPSSDLLPNLMVVFLFIKILYDKNAIHKQPLLFVIIPVFCLTIKLSAFIIGLFTLVVLWDCIKHKRYKNLAFLICLTLLIVCPWIVRTLIITGYVIYPFPSIDLFTFDWKVPLEYVKEQKDYIEAFARIDGAPIEDTLSLSLFQWLPRWWQSGMFYYTPYANRFFAIFMLMAIPSMGILYAALRRRAREYRHLFSAWIVAFMAVIFWFTSAPDFRFAYGFILPLCFIPIFIFIEIILSRRRLPKYLPHATSIIIILFVALQAIRWTYYQRDTKQPIIELTYKPQSLDYTRKLKEAKFENKRIEFIPQSINEMIINSANIETHCYDCPLPCSSDYTGGIEMRGKSLGDGFRCRPNAPHHRGY